ncbi:spore cortex-lytic enzyme [Desulforamulus ruminis]|uniref:Spore cortex-lytic enzyme n=2 Tax=Desulforamulus ruminis TaxID=1564 RepID=F6DUM9_DESRL|nr:spore cortex-lytic enzyme [Desulforamulus ruminis]AEG60167.1 spore cortex-lytic enzyme [Desulforamulus ruminis DSM 2154]
MAKLLHLLRTEVMTIIKGKKVAMLLSFFVFSLLLILPLQKADAYLGDRTLRYGSQGYDVQQLQKNLGYLGYKVGKVDGAFGWQTLQAVKNFQGNNGLVADGIVGKITANALIRQVSGGQAQRAQTQTVSRGSISLSRQDMYDLARIVYGEARGESFQGQVAVASVVLNRLYSGQFGNSVQEVIYQPLAFTAVQDGQFYMTPNSSAYQAVDAAVKGWDPTGGAIYYWNPVTATSKWVWNRPIVTKIGQHVFAL